MKKLLVICLIVLILCCAFSTSVFALQQPFTMKTLKGSANPVIGIGPGTGVQVQCHTAYCKNPVCRLATEIYGHHIYVCTDPNCPEGKTGEVVSYFTCGHCGQFQKDTQFPDCKYATGYVPCALRFDDEYRIPKIDHIIIKH